MRLEQHAVERESLPLWRRARPLLERALHLEHCLQLEHLRSRWPHVCTKCARTVANPSINS